MSFSQTVIGGTAIVGAATVAIQTITPDSRPAIAVHDIQIYDDGSTLYDRTPVEGAWMAWSGQIFKEGLDVPSENRAIHCRGGDLNQYFNSENPLESKDVDWLVGDDCADGLQAGMTYRFSWTPVDDDFSPVFFPAHGYGVVLPADQKPE